MNIQTVIANLLNTIEGKEAYLQVIQRERTMVGLRDGEGIALQAIAECLTINLKELNAILADCMAVREADIVRDLELKDAQRKAQQAHSDAAWQRDWDRQQAETNEGKWI